jgi:Zn-dependent protease
MNASTDMDELSRIVGRVMAVEETTLGGTKQTFAFRACGRLTVDSETAYDRLEAAGKPFGLTPLLREENGRHEILFVKGLSPKGTGNPRVNLVLFLLTLASVIYTAAVSAVPASAMPCIAEPTAEESWKAIGAALQWGFTHLDAGLPFALSFLAVLGTHELGHYLAGRRNGTAVTLPFFIPLPPLISPFGTMGAVISMRGAPKNRNSLAEIGIAGPLSGFLIGLPLLLIGLSLSRVEPLSAASGPCEGSFLEGNSLLYLLAKWTVFGKILPTPAQFDIPPVLFYLRSFFTGYPLSTPGFDVRIHNIAFGAWAGLMVTGLNLIPAGQLDGGHLLFVLLGKRAGRYLPWIIGGLCVLGLFWPGWFLLAVLVLIFGRVHAEPLDSVTPLNRRNRALAWVGLILFLLLFTPVPLQVSGG